MAEKMTERAAAVFAALDALFPDARCELRYNNRLELLIAVMLSAQTTDVAVNAVTPSLFARYADAAAYAAAPEGEIETLIRHLGLFHTKAKNLRAACRLIAENGGDIPADEAFLIRLPGVGRKTANVFLAEAYGVPRIAVDTHVARVARRLGFAPAGDAPAQTEKRLMAVFPSARWIELHHKLIFFGRYFCTARRPACARCPLVARCVEPQLESPRK